MITTIHYIVILLLLTFAAIYDLTRHRIPNFLTLPFIFIGGTINIIYYGWDGLQNSVIGIFVPMVLLILFAFQMLGAGDIKLFIGIGAILGWKLCIYSMALSFFLGGILAFFIMLIRKNGRKRFGRLYRYVMVSIGIRRFEPYDTMHSANDGYFSLGLCIAVGTIGVLILNHNNLLISIFSGGF